MNNAQSQSPAENQQITLQELQQHFMEPQSGSHDDFLEQMLSSLAPPPPPYDHDQENNNSAAAFHHDQLSLASKFRSHHIAPKPPLLLHPHHNNHPLLDPSPFKSPGGSDNGLYSSNAFGSGSLPSPNGNNPFHHPPPAHQTFGGGVSQAINQTPAPSGSSGGAQAVHARPRVRARRGQATDPHSIAERLRRERIAERMKALQELVPNANKTDKASMLDEIIDYVKFLQLQVKVLSMSRLGGAATVAPPHAADKLSEAGGDSVQMNDGAHRRSNSNGRNNETMTVTEHQVAKLMEEDMGSAMQYLQGKGLCLMPISLATAISTATCHSRNPLIANTSPDGPTSPNLSVLTVSDGKDATSVSKP